MATLVIVCVCRRYKTSATETSLWYGDEFAHPGMTLSHCRGCPHPARNQIPWIPTARLIREFYLILSVTSFWLASLLAVAGCAASRNHARMPYGDSGRTQFESYCAACHLSHGPGMMGEAPPLEGSSWVVRPENRMIKIVLQGLRGTIEVHDKTYNQEMPGFGEILTDAEIASLLSFVRKRSGGASTPILPATVSRVRAATRNRTDYWTVDELLREP